MRRSLAAAFAAVLALFLIAATPGAACACSCVEQTDAEAFADADAVFTGTLDDIDEEGFQFGVADGPATLEFEVDEVYKGEVSERQGVVTIGGDASCGWRPPEGERYLVVAYFEDGELHAGLCGGSRALDEGPIVFDVEAYAPEPGESGLAPFPVWPVVGAAALVAAAAVWIVLRRRRA
ncbi:hypothetical protein [Glycomyces paridis]|uniref:Uncharacterized protein n=1 Tax=Glycomyces paridis TaxID=2126555 RepID=A0A4S8PEM2_9ACTN|nr:hypothetical protein [Glycomyces paridis]THV28055.1 hypothetical protein E9998_13840 [Glycomyces paridis]